MSGVDNQEDDDGKDEDNEVEDDKDEINEDEESESEDDESAVEDREIVDLEQNQSRRRIVRYNNSKRVEDIDKMSSLMGWNDLQNLIYAKKSMNGMAQLFLRSEDGLVSWKVLKERLLKQFGEHVSAADIHKGLSTTKKRPEEASEYYLLKMKEMASQGNIDESDLIEYVADGIVDDSNDKVMLYGAKDFEELIEKLRIYDRYNKSQCSQSKKKFEKKTVSIEKMDRCFNCGNKGHKATNCDSKNLGVKCFAYNEFGHRSTNCPKKTTSNQNNSPN